MAEAVIQIGIILKWFAEQPEENKSAVQGMRDLHNFVKRMTGVLQDSAALVSSPRGLQSANEVLHNLWQCLHEAKRVYAEHKGGFKWKKPWQTPKKISAMAELHTSKLRGAFMELQVVLNLVNHDMMQNVVAPAVLAGAERPPARRPPAPPANNAHPAAPTGAAGPALDEEEQLRRALALSLEGHAPAAPQAAPAEDSAEMWELPLAEIQVQNTDLGHGTSNVCRLGLFTGDIEGRPGVRLPVAIKMALPSRLEAARRDAALVTQFHREVEFMCRLSHPHIAHAYGAVTRNASSVLCLWVVLEKLERNLHSALVIDKTLPCGREDPALFSAIITGIVSALAYLHAPVDRKAIIHGHLQPTTILLTSSNVPKLSNFCRAKATRSGDGAGSTVVPGKREDTTEWTAPEQRQHGTYSTASDMFALGLVGQFLWTARTPQQQRNEQASPIVWATAHELAGYALHLLRACLNPASSYRPAAASVSLELQTFRPIQAHLALPVSHSVWARQSLHARYVSELQRRLEQVERADFRPVLKRVCDDAWTTRDNWTVGGITGLMDEQSFLRLKHSLWLAAGRPGRMP